MKESLFLAVNSYIYIPHDTNKRNSFVWKYLYRQTATTQSRDLDPHPTPLCATGADLITHTSVGPNVSVSLQPGSTSGLVHCTQWCVCFHNNVCSVCVFCFSGMVIWFGTVAHEFCVHWFVTGRESFYLWEICAQKVSSISHPWQRNRAFSFWLH